MESIDLPAGTVHYRAFGPADGQPVVFVHGFLVDTTLWSDVPQRLGEAGYRTYAPTWPLGAHTTPMNDGADLSPRGVARVVTSFLEALDLTDVLLVGSDTGGAVSQLVLDEDPSRVGRLALTNCDAFDTFPPFPFDVLFKVARLPGLSRALLQSMRSTWLRHSRLGFGGLVTRALDPAESRPWVEPYLSDAGVRRDVTAFARGWTGKELSDASTWLSRFDRPVLLCWAPEDPYFKLALATRLAETFPDARLVELPGTSTFVSLDQPDRLAEEILAWLGDAAA
jgi:pimeloyl-ACP methyl ester carboxylesterase